MSSPSQSSGPWSRVEGKWSGDILTLYGIMGLLLPTVARLLAAGRTLAMLALFAVPVATHAVVLASTVASVRARPGTPRSPSPGPAPTCSRAVPPKSTTLDSLRAPAA